MTIFIYSSCIISTVQHPLVETANSCEDLHWNSSSLEAMKSVVTPMGCNCDLATPLVFCRKLSRSATAR